MEWTWDAPLGSGYGRYKQVGEGFVSEACAECCYRRFPILDWSKRVRIRRGQSLRNPCKTPLCAI